MVRTLWHRIQWASAQMICARTLRRWIMHRIFCVLSATLLTLVVSASQAKEVTVQLYEDPNVSLPTVSKLVESAATGDTLVLINDRVIHAVVIPDPAPKTTLDRIAERIDSLQEASTHQNRSQQSNSLQIIELARKRSHRGMLDWKEYEDGAFRFVFVRGRIRYTVYNSGTLLSFWTRPDGTVAQSELFTFTDHWLDDSVDFGISGDDPRVFISNALQGENAQYPECQQAWQDILVAAQKATIEFLTE